MKIRIYGIYPDGTKDTWLIEADTFEELREMALNIKESRNLINAWSEQVDD